MNRLRAWIRGFFGFSRTETNAFLIMLPLMATMVLSPPLYRWWRLNLPDTSQQDAHSLDSLIATWKWEKPDSVSIKSKPSYFIFNPNTATHDDFIRLGFSEKMTSRILNYRTKGGRFKIKKDLGKIFGVDSLLVAELLPYINLPQNITLPTRKALTHFPAKISQQPFDLNSADTAQLVKIYGIGPRLSLRIVAYRNRLGGFISRDQLKEVYGLDSTVIRQLEKKTFITTDFRPLQININKANEKQLASFPYIRFTLAKSIVVYRFQHGQFNSIEALKEIALMDDLTFQKIKPYITVKD